MTISSWLNFGLPMPPGRGSVAGRKFLAPPYYSQRAMFVSLLSYTVRYSAHCIVITSVCLCVCGSTLLQTARSVCVASERFFISTANWRLFHYLLWHKCLCYHNEWRKIFGEMHIVDLMLHSKWHQRLRKANVALCIHWICISQKPCGEWLVLPDINVDHCQRR